MCYQSVSSSENVIWGDVSRFLCHMERSVLPFDHQFCALCCFSQRLFMPLLEIIVQSGPIMTSQLARFMGPTWGRQDPGGPHVGPMNLALWDGLFILWNTVRCHYNTVSVLQNIHNRHPIARPWGRAMGCLLLVQALINVLPWSLQWCMHYHVILHHIKMTLTTDTP